MTTRLALLVVLAVGCKGKEKTIEAPSPVATRVDAVALELDLLPAWKSGGPEAPGADEASYFRGDSAAEPDALIWIMNTDMDLSGADDDKLLFLSKTVGAQIVRAGGTCKLVQLGSHQLGRCQAESRPLVKTSYTVPIGSRTYNLLFQWRADGASLTAEADAIVASLRPAN